MDRMKPWQIALFIIAAVVLGGSLAFSFIGGKSVDKAERIYLVDLRTGKLYYAPVTARGAVLVPARDPETKERTLYQVMERDDGSWELEFRSASSIDRSKFDRIHSDGTVDVLGEDPVKYVAPPFD